MGDRRGTITIPWDDSKARYIAVDNYTRSSPPDFAMEDEEIIGPIEELHEWRIYDAYVISESGVPFEDTFIGRVWEAPGRRAYAGWASEPATLVPQMDFVTYGRLLGNVIKDMYTYKVWGPA
jgi:hypothetical protein